MQIFDIAKKHSKMAQLYVKYFAIVHYTLIKAVEVREGHEQEGCEAASPASVLKHNK